LPGASALFLRVPLIQGLQISKSRSSKISNYDMFIIRTIVRDTNNTRILMIAARGCQGKTWPARWMATGCGLTELPALRLSAGIRGAQNSS